MKIEIVDTNTRLVHFENGRTIRVIRAWKRIGGNGWVPTGVLAVETYRTISEAAMAGLRKVAG